MGVERGFKFVIKQHLVVEMFIYHTSFFANRYIIILPTNGRILVAMMQLKRPRIMTVGDLH